MMFSFAGPLGGYPALIENLNKQMKTKINSLLVFSAFCLLSYSCSNSVLTPKEAIAKMSPGINIGNILEAPEEGEWNDQFFTEKFFSDFVDAGYKSVRIPVTWHTHAGMSLPYSINETFMRRIEQIVDWALSKGLIVIIDAHHEDWLKEDYCAQNKQRFDSIWSQIAFRFKDKSENLWFEPLNEPRTLEHEGLTQEQVDELNERIISIIRKTNKTRIVMYSGGGWGHEGTLMRAKVPDDPYVLASYHSYNPWPFAGEGDGEWGEKEDVEKLASVFDQVRAWADSNSVEVAVSEWGATKYGDFNSRMKHYSEYAKNMARVKFAGVTWDDGSGFNLYNRRTGKWNPFINDVIMNAKPTSPSEFTLAPASELSAVSLQWENRGGYDSILVERSTRNEPFKQIVALGGDEDTYLDSTAVANKRYYYRIAAYSENGHRLSCYPQTVIMED